VREIAVVGAAQSGLQLALELQGAGFGVTLVAQRTPEQARAGRPRSTQAIFGPARALERAAGLALWDGVAPETGSLHVVVGGDGQPARAFEAAACPAGPERARRSSGRPPRARLQDEPARKFGPAGRGAAHPTS
jgi:2-polyprenyl-6-methoxyphenol hydroxylase-like FAD-dependent oxidoreductase